MFASCTRHGAAWPRLLEAEQLLETDLNAACALIDSLDATSLSGEDAALYAILKTQADYKRYLPLISDSLPRLATDYYGTPYRKNHHAAMAWYSLGCYYYGAKTDEDAIHAYFTASGLFPDTLSRYYALTKQNLGRLYLTHNMYPEALHQLLLFKNHPLCADDSANVSFADFYLGQTYLYMLQTPEAEDCFNAVLENPHARSYFVRMSHFELAKQKYHVDHDTIAALTHLDEFISTGSLSERSGAAFVLKGDIMLGMNLPDSALLYYTEGLELSHDIYCRCHACQQLMGLGLHFSDRQLFDECLSEYSELKDSIFTVSQREKLTDVEHEYQLTLLQQKANHRQNVLFLSFAMALSVIVLALIVRKNIKLLSAVRYSENVTSSQLAEIDIAVGLTEGYASLDYADFATVQADEESRDVSNQELIPADHSLDLLVASRKERMKLYREHFKKSKYYQLLMSPSMTQEYMKQFKSVPLQVLLDELEDMCRDFILELRKECPRLTSRDALLCVCLMLRMPVLSIENLEIGTDRALITRKSRIRRKLTDCWNLVLFFSSSIAPILAESVLFLAILLVTTQLHSGVLPNVTDCVTKCYL